MRNRMRLMLLLICALAICGCASNGGVKPLVCPSLPPVPQNLMQPPTTEQRVRAELFEQPPKQTQKSAPSKTSSDRNANHD